MTSDGPARSSFWIRTFDLARQLAELRPEEWLRVPRLYTRATASQVTSDINNAHRRPATVRMRGILDGEVWEARWDDPLHGPRGHFAVHIRRVVDPTVASHNQ